MMEALRHLLQPHALTIPLFPLKAVLFPEGVLPLKIFEQRYLDMTKECLRDNTPFGICRLVSGEEVGPGAEFADIGTLCNITDWDMPQLGIFQLTVQGGQRFQIKSHRVQANGLHLGEVSLVEAEAPTPIDPKYEPLIRLLAGMIERIGESHFPKERHLDNASWVSYRLAEILPLKLSIKQHMLEINDGALRLEVIAKYMKQQGLLG